MSEISQYTINYLAELAELEPDKEICGFILHNQAVHPILNISKNPERNFEMDPLQQLKVIEAFTGDKLGDGIIGMYHSHPVGNPAPSDLDLSCWTPLGWRYWIVSGSLVIEWAIGNGKPFCVSTHIAESARKLVGTVPWNSASG